MSVLHHPPFLDRFDPTRTVSSPMTESEDPTNGFSITSRSWKSVPGLRVLVPRKRHRSSGEVAEGHYDPQDPTVVGPNPKSERRNPLRVRPDSQEVLLPLCASPGPRHPVRQCQRDGLLIRTWRRIRGRISRRGADGRGVGILEGTEGSRTLVEV